MTTDLKMQETEIKKKQQLLVRMKFIILIILVWLPMLLQNVFICEDIIIILLTDHVFHVELSSNYPFDW